MALDLLRLYPRASTAELPEANTSGAGNGIAPPTTASTSLEPVKTEAPGAPDGPAIAFDDSSYPDRHVFVTDLEGAELALRWSVAERIVITDVAWIGQQGGNGEFSPIMTAEVDRSSKNPSNPSVDLFKVNGTTAVFYPVLLDDRTDGYVNFPMAIKIDWMMESESGSGIESGLESASGYAQSDLFSIVMEEEDVGTVANRLEGNSDYEGVVVTETNSASPSTSMRASIPTGSSGDEPSPGNGNIGSDDDDGGSGGGGGGGLSTGAIAGIAVGAALIGIALIGGLVWFLLCRRRQNKLQAGYAAREKSNTFMVEKEMSSHNPAGGAVAEGYDDSPRGPYSDDGNDIHQHAPAPARAPDDREFSPYDDDSVAAPPHAQDNSQNPHGVSRSVAHLVEEGMTPEQIRRLEEEERQLDAEIERSGRR